MYAKIQITGILEVVTGLHIGGNNGFAAIGAVDSPVIKDSRGVPIIPGSSLKGKIRSLLAKAYNPVPVAPSEDADNIQRLFGSVNEKEKEKQKEKQNEKQKAMTSRIIFSDMFLSNREKLKQAGISNVCEVKFENNINRQTAVATPRQIERVIRGAEFDLDLVYEVSDEAQAVEDLRLLAEGMRLLQYDYLGGNGSRGYGKVRFHDLDASVVVGEVSEETEQKIREIFLAF